MEDRLIAASTIAASQLKNSTDATPKLIADLLTRAFEGIDIAMRQERIRVAQRQAELKSNSVVTRRSIG